ncbi:MAG: PqqD family protein [Lentisphaerae bacterium]|nr:PqqD family protein [Lentisphaerota bacterium]
MTYLQKKDVVARSVAGEHLLIPVQGCTASVYTLNGVGRWLWALIETPRTEEDLDAAIVARYHIPRETACADVRRFLSDLTRMGLVEKQG